MCALVHSNYAADRGAGAAPVVSPPPPPRPAIEKLLYTWDLTDGHLVKDRAGIGFRLGIIVRLYWVLFDIYSLYSVDLNLMGVRGVS